MDQVDGELEISINLSKKDPTPERLGNPNIKQQFYSNQSSNLIQGSVSNINASSILNPVPSGAAPPSLLKSKNQEVYGSNIQNSNVRLNPSPGSSVNKPPPQLGSTGPHASPFPLGSSNAKIIVPEAVPVKNSGLPEKSFFDSSNSIIPGNRPLGSNFINGKNLEEERNVPPYGMQGQGRGSGPSNISGQVPPSAGPGKGVISNMPLLNANLDQPSLAAQNSYPPASVAPQLLSNNSAPGYASGNPPTQNQNVLNNFGSGKNPGSVPVHAGSSNAANPVIINPPNSNFPSVGASIPPPNPSNIANNPSPANSSKLYFPNTNPPNLSKNPDPASNSANISNPPIQIYPQKIAKAPVPQPEPAKPVNISVPNQVNFVGPAQNKAPGPAIIINKEKNNEAVKHFEYKTPDSMNNSSIMKQSNLKGPPIQLKPMIIPRDEFKTNLKKVLPDEILRYLESISSILTRTLDYNLIFSKPDEFFSSLSMMSQKSEDAKKVLRTVENMLICKVCNKRELLMELRCGDLLCSQCLSGAALKSVQSHFKCPACNQNIEKMEEERIFSSFNIDKEQIQKELLKREYQTNNSLHCKICKKIKKQFYSYCQHMCKECYADKIREDEVPCNICHESTDYDTILFETFNCDNCDNQNYFIGSYGKLVKNESLIFCIVCAYELYNLNYNTRHDIHLKKLEKIELNDHIFKLCSDCKREIYKANFTERPSCKHKVCCDCAKESICKRCTQNSYS